MRLFSSVTTGLSRLLFVFTIFLFANSSMAAIPDLEANKDERSLSNPSYILGQHWFRKLNGSQALIDFPPAYDYLKNTLSKLLPQTSLYNKTVEITLLNSSKSNAFVIPGSHLFIYSDILEAITSEDMLLGLLAHEVAHLELRHYERQKQRSSEELQKTLTLIGAGIAAALAGADADTTTALWLGGLANQAENTLTYSRIQEQEADRRGRQYLISAGLSPDGMNDLFRAFFKKALGRPKLEFLSTHPSPDTRLSDSFNADKKETIINYKEPSDFEYFRATLLAYRAGLEEKPYAYLEQQIQDPNAQNFAKGLFSYLIQSPDRALVFLTKIDKDNRFTDYIKALSYSAAGQKEQSIEIITQQLNIAPNDTLFSMLLAQLNKFRPKALEATYLYEKRLIWKANIQYFQSIRNIPMALNFQALLNFSQGKDEIAQGLIKRALGNASENDKNKLKTTESYFEKIKEAEEKEDIK